MHVYKHGSRMQHEAKIQNMPNAMQSIMQACNVLIMQEAIQCNLTCVANMVQCKHATRGNKSNIQLCTRMDLD